MALLISQGADKYDEFLDNLRNGTVTAAQIAKAQLDTLGGQFKLLSSKLERVAIDLGSVLGPEVRRLMDRLGGLLDSFIALDDETKETIVTWGAFAFVAALVSTALAAVLAKLPLIVAGTVMASKGFTLAATTMLAWAGKVAAVMAGISSGTITMGTVMTGLAAKISGVLVAVKVGLAGAAVAAKGLVIALLPVLAKLALIAFVVVGVAALIASLVVAWQEFGGAAGDALKDVMTWSRKVWDDVAKRAGDAFDTVAGWIGDVAQYFVEAWDIAGSAIAATIDYNVGGRQWRTILDDASGYIGSFLQNVVKAFRIVGTALGDIFGGVFDSLRETLTWIWNKTGEILAVAAKFWGK